MLCQLLCWIQCKTRILKEFQSHIKLTSLTIAVFTFQRSAMCLTFEGYIYILMSMISEPSDLKCLSFHCIWKWAVSFQCLLRSCFVCDKAHTPNCHPSVDTSHFLRCLWVSKQWADSEHKTRRVYSVNIWNYQRNFAFSSETNTYCMFCI